MADTYSPALKEIAGRLQSLSYKDMLALGDLLGDKLDGKEDCGIQSCAEALLETAETIANGPCSKEAKSFDPKFGTPPGVRR